MNSDNLKFHISEKVINLGVTGIYLVVNGVRNRDKDNQFETYKKSVLRELLKKYSSEGFVENDPILAGFRELHTKVDRSNRRFVSAPEVLISRFIRNHQFPHVNLLVDIYNLISLKTRLALGAKVEIRLLEQAKLFTFT